MHLPASAEIRLLPLWAAVQVRGLFAEARMAARRKGALAMVVEESLQMARFLAGLDPHQVRMRGRLASGRLGF